MKGTIQLSWEGSEEGGIRAKTNLFFREATQPMIASRKIATPKKQSRYDTNGMEVESEMETAPIAAVWRGVHEQIARSKKRLI